MQPHDPYVLPPNLPEPEDDGAVDHLPGARIPSLVLDSSQGPVDVAELCAGLGTPVFPPDRNAADVVAYLRATVA